jgi:hypothetical protein
MPEALPDRHFVDLMDRAAYLRGRYLTSYAQCEFLLADLSVRVDNRFRYALDNASTPPRLWRKGLAR